MEVSESSLVICALFLIISIDVSPVIAITLARVSNSQTPSESNIHRFFAKSVILSYIRIAQDVKSLLPVCPLED